MVLSRIQRRLQWHSNSSTCILSRSSSRVSPVVPFKPLFPTCSNNHHIEHKKESLCILNDGDIVCFE
jgi:hypothetical protein